MNIIEVETDRTLLGQFIEDPRTFQAWFAYKRAVHALPPADGDMAIYEKCTGRSTWPTAPATEIWNSTGRKGGKSFNIALDATYLAGFRTYRLSPGEMGYVVCVAPTKEQAAIIKRYISGFFRENDFLRPLVVRETREVIELNTGVGIMVLSSDFRSIRGFTAIAVIVDEVAFMMDEGSRPDVELLRALRPALAMTGGPLICISSPYAKRGVLYAAWKAHYGKDGDPVLFWQAPSILMNPTLAQGVIDRAKEDDPEAAASEWDAQFRSDIETFVSREAVEACVVPGRYELPPLPGVQYVAFVDPSGGGQDDFTLAIAHNEDGKAILDAVRDRKTRNPEAVVEEYAALVKSYRVREVVGDRYSGEWVRSAFRKFGIEYRPSEKNKSELYLGALPIVNSGKAELLDNGKLIGQLCRLERRTSRGGKDSIDHPPNSHDDTANVCCGALVLVSQEQPMPGFFFIDTEISSRSLAWAEGRDLD